jgi:predicted esterase
VRPVVSHPGSHPSALGVRCVVAFVATAAALLHAAPAAAKQDTTTPDPLTLEVPGFPDAYYYKPRSKAQKPILMYLHGRGGNPFEDCRKWSKVATQFGWLVCPGGQHDRGNGEHTWNNDPVTAKKLIDAAVAALRRKYKTRVRSRGNLLMGFSEGAFIAQQVGVHDPQTWNRWLILAANDSYWFGDAPQLLDQNKKKIRKVYLFTGEFDMVAGNTVRAGDMLKERNIPVRVQLVPGMGHEVPADRMVANYRRPLRWLISAK